MVQAETEEDRGRRYLGELLDAAVRLQRGNVLETKIVDAKHLVAELSAASDWVSTVLPDQERLSPALAAYRNALSELRASAEARLADLRAGRSWGAGADERSHLSQRLDLDVARAREVLEAYDPVVLAAAQRSRG